MKALENLTRDVVPLACLGAALTLVLCLHPYWAGGFMACAVGTWLLGRA